jgi:hypothetical protein
VEPRKEDSKDTFVQENNAKVLKVRTCVLEKLQFILIHSSNLNLIVRKNEFEFIMKNKPGCLVT